MAPPKARSLLFSGSGWLAAFLVVATGILLLLFLRDGAQALATMDAPVWWFHRIRETLRHGFTEMWFVEPWLGIRYGSISPDLNLLLLGFLPFPWSTTVLCSFNLLIAGGGMCFLLRSLKLVPIASVIGGMAFMLTNNVITLCYAGHVNKLMTYAWIPWSIAFFLRGVRGGSFRDYLVSGAFFGLGLLGGEVQILYYLGLWYTVWLALSLWQRHRDGGFSFPVAARHGAGLVAVASCALTVGVCVTLHHWRYLGANSPVVGAADTNQNWLFATQYFFPVEEVLSFFTTGQFFGGPQAYWGRCGSPMPLRLSDDYLGLLPAGLAILGGVACWRIWQARLFIVMGLGSLLISFGRDGGLFLLLYQLPTMKSQRNPHRWTYFVALAACVLAGYGANWLWERLRQSRSGFQVPGSDRSSAAGETRNQERGTGVLDSPSWALWKRGLLAAGAVGILLFAFAWVIGRNPAGAAQTFYGAVAMASPQGPLFAERAHSMLLALTRTGLFLALASLSAWWLIVEGSKPEAGGASWRKALPWGALLLVLALDLGLNAKRFVVFYPWRQAIEEHPVANYLRQDKDLFRVKVIGAQQNPLLNNLVSNILPYHGIAVVDPPAVSRIPNDYSALFKHFEGHYVRSDRYFDFFNVKYVLSPGPFADPSTPFVPMAQWNGINIYRREHFLPRAWLVPAARVVKGGEEEILNATLHPLTDLRETVVLEEAPKAVPVDVPRSMIDGEKPSEAKVAGGKFEGKRGTPSALAASAVSNLEPRRPNDLPRSVRVTRYEDNRVELETEAVRPTILVLGDKWDSDWKARVDGQPAPILKGNFLMRAVELPAGRHSVKMEYRPSTLPFKVSAACVLLFAAYGLWGGMRALGRK